MLYWFLVLLIIIIKFKGVKFLMKMSIGNIESKGENVRSFKRFRIWEVFLGGLRKSMYVGRSRAIWLVMRVLSLGFKYKVEEINVIR